MKEIANTIKILRKRKGWTQTELAERLEASQRTITAYETGRKTPSVQKLIVLAQIFDCTLDELVGRKDIEIIDEVPMVHKNSRTFLIQGYYEKLSPEEQRSILKQVKALADKRE